MEKIKDPRAILKKTPLAEQLNDKQLSRLRRYQKKVVGDESYASLFLFEISYLLCGNLPGMIGYLLRKKLLGPFFKEIGPGVILGRAISLRHPCRIRLGRMVAIDDYVLMDAGGAGKEGIVLCDNVIVSRNCVIQGKSSFVSIGSRTDIGCNTVISSASGIYIGRDVLIAGNCYLGGAQYVSDRLDIPIMDQGSLIKFPLQVGDGTWIGAGATVLDGVRIGSGCIVGAGAVVVNDLPEKVVAGGVPAKVIRHRGQSGDCRGFENMTQGELRKTNY